MVDKIELPQAQIVRLVKDGASQVDGGTILNKETKQAFSQIAGLFILYLSST